MLRALVFTALVVVAVATPLVFNEQGHLVPGEQAPAINQDIITKINTNPETTWHAGVNERFRGFSVEEVKGLLGTVRGGPKPLRTVHHEKIDLPDSFDSREKWSGCAAEILDQGECGSCWAFGAIEALTDRFCIAGKKDVLLAAQDLVSCENDQGGCNGGYPYSAWIYMQDSGVVVEECYPYEMPPCDHPCGKTLPTPACNKTCANGQKWEDAKKYASDVYQVSSDEDAIMTELYKNGPVEVDFTVYEDFVHYKSGVYVHQTGSMLGGHAVKAIGWGVENGVKYWIIANSWNTNWGDQGLFKIRRGTDECGIEDDVIGGTPKV